MTRVTALTVHVFFFSESIMSDKSDLNCFKGHIFNKEIDRAKVIYSRKQEEFLRLISQQPKPRYSNLPRDELGTSLIPEDVTGADDRLVALKAKVMEIAFSIPSPFCYLVTKTDRTSCDYWWLENCISIGHFTLTTMLSTTQLHQIQIFSSCSVYCCVNKARRRKLFSHRE